MGRRNAVSYILKSMGVGYKAVGDDQVFNLTNSGVISTVSMVQTYQLVTVNTFSTVPT